MSGDPVEVAKAIVLAAEEERRQQFWARIRQRCEQVTRLLGPNTADEQS
jgi:hypothetical protein